jgi:glycerol uptake facilitator protein
MDEDNPSGEELFEDEHDDDEREEEPVSQKSTKEPKEPFWTPMFVRQLLAEAVGTFIIVQIGTASVMAAIYEDAFVGLFQIAWVWIIAVTLAIGTTGPISGAHLNPAISISLSILRPSPAFGVGKLILYIIAQMVGAINGSLVNLFMYNDKIVLFEAKNNIIRGTPESYRSAAAFGEYYV